MIDKYIEKLIENLPSEVTSQTIELDLVLDGGAFNGSYLVGGLMFLKEMEKRNYVKVNKISGCSIGSFVALLYFMDKLELMNTLYVTIKNDFKKEYTLKKCKEIHSMIEKDLPENICEIVNNRLYVVYNNVIKGRQVVKCSYESSEDLMETIIRSCYVPFLFDGNLLYKNKYFDGVTPFIFSNPKIRKSENSKKTLFFDLYGYDKIYNTINIKNERNNFHRLLSGVLEMHNFFVKQSNTSMCSYIEDWNVNYVSYYYCKIIISKIILHAIVYMHLILKIIPKNYNLNNNIIIKIFKRILYDIYVIILENYFI